MQKAIHSEKKFDEDSKSVQKGFLKGFLIEKPKIKSEEVKMRIRQALQPPNHFSRTILAMCKLQASQNMITDKLFAQISKKGTQILES
jgi:hypothetical protein